MSLLSKIIQIFKESETYKGEHESPDASNGKPMHDIVGIYPEDFYSSIGYNHYASSEEENGGREAYHLVVDAKNRPYKKVAVYRAVPKDIGITDINKGDWVSLTKSYAKFHGQTNLNNKFKILTKVVRAKDLFTDGNSIVEWGFDPQIDDPIELKKNAIKKSIVLLDKLISGQIISVYNKIPTDMYYGKNKEELEAIKAEKIRRLNSL